jgi:hypothetical protein
MLNLLIISIVSAETVNNPAVNTVFLFACSPNTD